MYFVKIIKTIYEKSSCCPNNCVNNNEASLVVSGSSCSSSQHFVATNNIPHTHMCSSVDPTLNGGILPFNHVKKNKVKQ